MADPDVLQALARAGLSGYARVRLVHATSKPTAEEIASSGRLAGDETQRAWLADTDDIAPLHHGGGATATADAPAQIVEALVDVEVRIDDLYFETTRDGDNGPVELFYLLDAGSGCPVTVVAVRDWP
jgi:hypothetical protein